MRQAIFLLCLWSCSLLTGHAQEADEANYDESKIPPYTLPALLKTSDGREITTVQQWEQIRRPELLSVFTEQVYGKMPADKVDVSYKKLDDNHSAVNGSATRKQIEITFSHNGIERKALLLMYLPNHVKTKVPVFLHFNFQGNQTVSSDPDIIPSQYSDRPRGNQASRWPVERSSTPVTGWPPSITSTSSPTARTDMRKVFSPSSVIHLKETFRQTADKQSPPGHGVTVG